jgi:hypothetical protein
MPTIGDPEEGVGESSAITTETQLLNDALAQAGGCTRITAIDDGSVNANHCLTFYGPLRDALLRAHFWNFALVWEELAQDLTVPAIGFAYSYTLPGRFLRVHEYAGANPVSSAPLVIVSADMPMQAYYKIEGRTLRSNDGRAFLHFIQRLTNAAEWDPLFYQVLATWLGAKLALAIRKDEKASLLLMKQVNDILLPLALAVDGQEGSIEPYRVDDLLWGR